MSKSPGGVLLHRLGVDRGSTVPIYRQLDVALRKLILEGALRPAQKLPSSRELALELGVSRITVKSVYEQLVAEGYVEARTGAGTFVSRGLAEDASPNLRPPRRQAKPPGDEISDHAKIISSSKASVRHGKIEPFRPGVPALDLFPLRIWNRYLSDALTSSERQNLSYGHVSGSAALRAAISRHLADARSMEADPSQIVITSGGQQAFAMIAFVLLNQGDTVWYENPGHIAGRDLMRIMGARVAPVPIDCEGLDLDHAIKRHPKPAVIFTTPSHQQPLGTTMSLVRRLALLNYAQENNAWIIEDDYDSEFRYRGRPLPALSALDTERRVLYVGTFSKSMFASMRLGYIVVPPGLVDTFAKARNLLGQSSSTVVENAMACFMDDGRFVEHIRKMRRAYRDRRDSLYECLKQDCADHFDLRPTDAGMHLLAWLKGGVDDQAAHRALLEAGIESLPLSVYAAEPIGQQALVLGFSGVSEKRIPTLVNRMSEALDKLEHA
ncbi:MAG: PLP-dependent aminotransferase family protein [Alphaproteobacteria bacterium]|nr:PLP-dependent aminotransferase family protein [Alphaproteobacteria bacterium]